MVPFEQPHNDEAAPLRARMEQRTTAAAKALIERAARSVGLSASDFTVAAACRAAHETIQRYGATTIGPQDQDAFMRALDASEPTSELVDLMRLHGEAARRV